jgi:hypothetical protein
MVSGIKIAALGVGFQTLHSYRCGLLDFVDISEAIQICHLEESCRRPPLKTSSITRLSFYARLHEDEA